MTPSLRDIFSTVLNEEFQGRCRLHRGTVEVKADSEQH